MAEHPTPIHILIADDHPIIRDGLRRLLETEPDFQVVGAAADGEGAIQLARKLKPDILLLDLSMPRLAGLETLRELAALNTPVRTILLTEAIEKGQMVKALQLGARGVVLKESATELLFKSIRIVMAGQYWVGRESVTDLVHALLHEAATPPAVDPRASQDNFRLTSRELEILSALVAGLSNREIGQKLSLSEQTVKHHLTSIFDKLGVGNRLELGLYAIHHRLVGSAP
ncbi:MAG: response regulator transcription factor [Acidobacteria bacterium]|nr:response regulator transcription factor [Acidobacteriota bacterium]